jgi:arsenate reductase
VDGKPRILFVCVHNAGRSQMAAAFAKRIGAGRVDVISAGSAPSDRVHETVAEAMREVGIELAGAKPRVLERGDVEASAAVITMGCGDACPVFPGKRYEDWKVDDPAGQPIERVRAIRDEIRARVAALVESLAPAK